MSCWYAKIDGERRCAVCTMQAIDHSRLDRRGEELGVVGEDACMCKTFSTSLLCEKKNVWIIIYAFVCQNTKTNVMADERGIL